MITIDVLKKECGENYDSPRFVVVDTFSCDRYTNIDSLIAALTGFREKYKGDTYQIGYKPSANFVAKRWESQKEIDDRVNRYILNLLKQHENKGKLYQKLKKEFGDV